MWRFRCSDPSGWLLALVGVALLAVPGCLSSGSATDAELDTPRGEASYYADKFAGKTTASGEPFDPDAMTAAHPSLPFGTMVRVTRTDGTGRSVVVRINDRGPYADDRIIDLSEAAAEEIGMIEEGVVEVRIELIDQPEAPKKDDARSEGQGW